MAHHAPTSISVIIHNLPPVTVQSFSFLDNVKVLFGNAKIMENSVWRYNSKSDLGSCNGMSLSMYKDIESAIDSFYHFKGFMNEKVFRILGTKIAQGLLMKSDGVNERGKYGEIIIRGHFNHHPSKGYDYAKKFKIISSFLK